MFGQTLYSWRMSDALPHLIVLAVLTCLSMATRDHLNRQYTHTLAHAYAHTAGFLFLTYSFDQLSEEPFQSARLVADALHSGSSHGAT